MDGSNQQYWQPPAAPQPRPLIFRGSFTRRERAALRRARRFQLLVLAPIAFASWQISYFLLSGHVTAESLISAGCTAVGLSVVMWFVINRQVRAMEPEQVWVFSAAGPEVSRPTGTRQIPWNRIGRLRVSNGAIILTAIRAKPIELPLRLAGDHGLAQIQELARAGGVRKLR